MRTDVRRGKTLRRLAGDDAQVNEEWNCDKGRWAFKYVTQKDRITTPLVRGEDGQLHEASWPEALSVAAAGLEANRAAVLVGGRATLEDAYGYAKFARVALGTNDIDFRARLTSEEERSFLASHVVGTTVNYKDLDRADHVALLGFEAEEESPIVFLRLYKQVRKRGLKVTAVAPFASRGNKKLKAQLIATAAGNEAAAIAKISGLTNKSVILVGERLSESAGAISAAVALAQSSGAKLAWIPRRAGERGALEAGAIGTLLPGGRPVTDTAARVDLQAAWGVENLPANIGRDTNAILDDLKHGNIEALLVGGVDPLDISAHHHDGLAKAFVVSLEIRHSAITEIANVVLPVAAVVEKSGSFVNWEGRSRSFDTAIADSLTRSDVRILSMLADQMGTPINLPTVTAAREEFNSLGSWESRANFVPVAAASVSAPADNALLSSWRLLLDAGSLQDGENNLAGTTHPSVAVISAGRANSLGVNVGDLITVSTSNGAITLPCEIADIEESSVWIPRNSVNSKAIATLGVASGVVSVVKA
jgi:NADH-quinone oxidoreductase subunit G